MLDVRDLKITIGIDRVLIDKLNFSVGDGDKVAIIGEEGNGKSTIVKAIACPERISSYASVSGSINTYGQKIGYLEQILDFAWANQEVYRYFLKESPFDEDDYEAFEKFGELNKILAELKIDPQILESLQKIGELSGGEKVKIQLAKLLLANPDILILDEPTNDLDIETLEWLENFIINYKKPIIYISHDEELLEKTANAILHIEQLKRKRDNKCTFVHTGYADYVKERLSNMRKQTQVAQKERADDAEKMEKFRQIYNRVDHELNTITRQDPHGARLLKKKMQAVKSQERRFERERQEFTDFPETEEPIKIDFGSGGIPNGKSVLNLSIGQLEIGDKCLSKNIHLNVSGPEKVVIIGKNGVGKTTLLREIYSNLYDREDITVGYMPQNYEDELCQYNSVLDYVAENVDTKEELTKIRTYLGCLKFTHEEVSGDIRELSGGQKAKLFIAKLMMKECDVLILDEPTRNLSPLSNPVIREALCEYKGAIISISHDRKFIKEVSSRVLELKNDGLVDKTEKFKRNDDESAL